ncbi:WAT1-related protein [Platanthera guangdongensis]|uniref:WAT1-related protein n=1 Tax=Platanthera guangdongensis TaxID=2320717 RepID=A0ABR2N4A9_9ASPA
MTYSIMIPGRHSSLYQSLSGKAKILGTLVGVAGAMILTFFKGMELNFSTSVNLLKPHSLGGHDPTALRQEFGDRVMGSILAVASCFSYSIWLIIQVQILFGSAFFITMAGYDVLTITHVPNGFDSSCSIRSLHGEEQGAMAHGAWHSTLLSCLLAVLIVIGLYLVLWGKRKEGAEATVGNFPADLVVVVEEPGETQRQKTADSG